MNIDITLKGRLSGFEPAIRLFGEAFGSGPNIVLFDRFDGPDMYELPFNKKANIGRWTNKFGDAGFKPFLYEDLGRTWLSTRSADAITTSDQRLAGGFFKSVGSNFSEFRFSQRRWVPVGLNFPAATTPATLPNVSSWKPTWFAQNNVDSTELDGYQITNKADLVIDTYPVGTFMVNGNSIQPQGTGNVNGFSFTTPTFSSWYQKPIIGEDPGVCENMYYNNLTQWRNVTANDPFNLHDPEEPVDDEHYQAFNFGGWFGNGSDYTNVAPMLADCYLAIGPNSRACVLSSSHSTLAASGPNVWILPVISGEWDNSEIFIRPVDRERTGYYHVILSDGTLIENITWEDVVT
jgi:hypothetical protein